MRPGEVRNQLAARLRARHEELARLVGARIASIPAASKGIEDHAYERGQHDAIMAAIDSAVEVVLRGGRRPQPTPVAILSQARLSAQSRVPLETVLRRYVAGYTLVGDSVLEEAEACKMEKAEFKRLSRDLAATFDQVVEAVGTEYRRGVEEVGTPGEWQVRSVCRLLDGGLVDLGSFNYNFDAVHLGLIATGPGSERVVQELAEALGGPILMARRGGEVWGWLASRDEFRGDCIEEHLTALPDGVRIGLGEAQAELSGWRLTHRQARRALRMALRGVGTCVRYREVALLGAIAEDDLLVASLRRRYLEPLEAERDGGASARQTLRAYFASDRNVSSTAAALGTSRRTITNRLRAVEERFGNVIPAIAWELQAALRLEQVEESSASVAEVGERLAL